MATPAPTRVFPRRTFIAAILSAAVAGGAVTLAQMGGLTGVDAATFQFSRGAAWASGEEARLKGFLAPALADERISVAIVGHSGTQGDEAANLELSQTRADAAAALAQSIGLASHQITATAVGGGAPLAQQDGEGARAYQTRLARVDVALQLRR